MCNTAPDDCHFTHPWVTFVTVPNGTPFTSIIIIFYKTLTKVAAMQVMESSDTSEDWFNPTKNCTLFIMKVVDIVQVSH